MKKIFTLLLLLITFSLKAQIACNWAYVPVGPASAFHTIYISDVDRNGNIIQVGKILGNADMDPSPDPNDTSFCYGGFNYYISSTADSGKLNWIRYFEDNSQIGLFEFKGLNINSLNEIIVSGNYFGKIDFDLDSTGVDTLRSKAATYPDYFVAKYDSLGNYKWAISIGDSARTIQSHSLAVTNNNRILVVANPNGPVDVNPSANINNTIGGNANIICYDKDGKYIWNNHIGVTTSYGVTCKSIDTDASGNSYLLNVGYNELTVSKFSNAGSLLWDKTIGDFATGARVEPQSVLVNKTNGDFYVAGTFQGTVDFDPNALIFNKTSSSGFFQDGFIAKYDSSMNLLCVNHYIGKVSFGKYTLDFDGSNIISSGSFDGTIDFGSGNVLNAGALTLPFYLKINPAGITTNVFNLSGSGNFNTINSSINNKFIITGFIAGNTNMNYVGTPLIINSTVNNYFTAVYQNGITAGLSNANLEKSISIFPNPSSGDLNLNFDKTLVGNYFDIIDVTGKVVYHELIQKLSHTINISDLSNGFYTLIIANSNSKGVKFIKQ